MVRWGCRVQKDENNELVLYIDVQLATALPTEPTPAITGPAVCSAPGACGVRQKNLAACRNRERV